MNELRNSEIRQPLRIETQKAIKEILADYKSEYS